MINKIKSIFEKVSENNTVCGNELHKKICDCPCHKNRGMLHIINCCSVKKCPDCKKELRIINSF